MQRKQGQQGAGKNRGSTARVRFFDLLPRVLVILSLALLVLSWGAPTTSASPSGDRETVAGGWTRGEVISSGLYHTCALKSDGTATCWGLNGSGQSTAAWSGSRASFPARRSSIC